MGFIPCLARLRAQLPAIKDGATNVVAAGDLIQYPLTFYYKIMVYKNVPNEKNNLFI